jgi:hypothetical protein
MALTTMAPPTTVFISTTLWPYPKGKQFDPSIAFIRIAIQFAKLFSKPYMRPLNYHEYKKDFDPNAHV